MVRGDPRGYYRELGVHRTASVEEIRLAFRERAKLVHPDQGGAGVDQNFKRLAEAYEVLKDPRRRLQYDAEGLAAEREREQVARPAEPAGRRRAERPPRSAAPARPGPVDAALRRLPAEVGLALERLQELAQEARPRWLLPLAAGLAVVAVLSAAGFAWAWNRLGHKDEQLAQLASRHNVAVLRLADLESRYRALSVAAIDDAPPAGPAAELRPGRALFRSEIAFAPAATELDPALQAELDQAVIGLSRALRTVPEAEDWTILVDGYAGRAADEAGVALPDWEGSLMRLGVVVDRLVAQGLPAERIAARFQAGFAPPDQDERGAAAVEVKLVCCFR